MQSELPFHFSRSGFERADRRARADTTQRASAAGIRRELAHFPMRVRSFYEVRTHLAGVHVKKFRDRAVGIAGPVDGAGDAGKNQIPFGARSGVWNHDRLAVGVEAFRPGLLRVGLARYEFPGLAVEHVIKRISIRKAQQLARLSIYRAVEKNWRLGSVPIVRLVR